MKLCSVVEVQVCLTRPPTFCVRLRESDKASGNFEQGTNSFIRRSGGVTQSQIVASGSFQEQHNIQAWASSGVIWTPICLCSTLGQKKIPPLSGKFKMSRKPKDKNALAHAFPDHLRWDGFFSWWYFDVLTLFLKGFYDNNWDKRRFGWSKRKSEVNQFSIWRVISKLNIGQLYSFFPHLLESTPF